MEGGGKKSFCEYLEESGAFESGSGNYCVIVFRQGGISYAGVSSPWELQRVVVFVELVKNRLSTFSFTVMWRARFLVTLCVGWIASFSFLPIFLSFGIAGMGGRQTKNSGEGFVLFGILPFGCYGKLGTVIFLIMF